LKNDIPNVSEYQGRVSESADTLYNVLKLQDELSERLGKLYTYAHMRYDQDTTNSFYQALNAKAETVLTLAQSSMSYLVPEILKMEEGTIQSYLEEKEELKLYEHVLNEILRQRKHVLGEKEEVLLAEASEALSTGSQTFSMLNNADL